MKLIDAQAGRAQGPPVLWTRDR